MEVVECCAGGGVGWRGWSGVEGLQILEIIFHGRTVSQIFDLWEGGGVNDRPASHRLSTDGSHTS